MIFTFKEYNRLFYGDPMSDFRRNRIVEFHKKKWIIHHVAVQAVRRKECCICEYGLVMLEEYASKTNIESQKAEIYYY